MDLGGRRNYRCGMAGYFNDNERSEFNYDEIHSLEIIT